MIYIGIDPGRHTGVAVWDSEKDKILSLETMPIHRAMEEILLWTLPHIHEGEWYTGNDVEVIFEDARQRTWYGKGDVSAKMQGAGSIKRDCTIWEDFLKDNDIPFRAIPPVKGATKVSEEYIRALTGYKGRTSSHARDAAMLVIGR